MLDKETRQKIASCKALQGMSVADVLNTDRFRSNLAAYMKAQREDREQIRASYQAMRKLGGARGYKLPAHPIDRVIEMTVDEMSEEYGRVIGGRSKAPRAVRQYIEQLGRQAYNLTIAQFVVAEFPELESVLMPKAKAS